MNKHLVSIVDSLAQLVSSSVALLAKLAVPYSGISIGIPLPLVLVSVFVYWLNTTRHNPIA